MDVEEIMFENVGWIQEKVKCRVFANAIKNFQDSLKKCNLLMRYSTISFSSMVLLHDAS